MAISRSKKEELVAQYNELLDSSRAIFIVEYTGLTVKKLELLRQNVRDANGAYHITKNSLIGLVLKEKGSPVPEKMLVGQIATGFALGEVPTLAKTFVDFAKKEDKFILKGGMMGDTILSKAQIEALAELPSLDELRATIIGLISAPARDVVSVLASGVRQVVNVIDAYSKKEEAAA